MSNQAEPKNINRWQQILRASQQFHADITSLDFTTSKMEKPDFLDKRSNRWILADRVVWNDVFIDVPGINTEVMQYFGPPFQEVRSMTRSLPGDIDDQIIHGDLTGGVLFHDESTSAPSVVDITPYWRPAAYAEAIAIADGLAWYGEGEELLDLWEVDDVKI